MGVLLRLGWLLPRVVVGLLAQRARKSMPFYIVGAFSRAIYLALIAGLLALAVDVPGAWTTGGFLALWTLHAFISGIVAVPYNDIVGRSIPPRARSRMLRAFRPCPRPQAGEVRHSGTSYSPHWRAPRTDANALRSRYSGWLRPAPPTLHPKLSDVRVRLRHAIKSFGRACSPAPGASY
jgi:hypothetical protein